MSAQLASTDQADRMKHSAQSVVDELARVVHPQGRGVLSSKPGMLSQASVEICGLLRRYDGLLFSSIERSTGDTASLHL